MPTPIDSTSLPCDEPPHRLEDDDAGAEQDQHALDRRGEVLDLLVAVGVVLVGRLVGLAHREEGHHRRDQVDARVGRLGEDRDRAGDRRRRELEHDQQRVRGDRDRRRAVLAGHLRVRAHGARGGHRGRRPASAARVAPGHLRRLRRSAGPRPRASSAWRSASFRASARAARPRWLIASFSLADELGHRAAVVVVRRHEGRVVPEAAVAARLGGQHARRSARARPPRARPAPRRRARTRRLTRRSLGRHLAQQLREVLLVGGVLAGVAGRPHPGRARRARRPRSRSRRRSRAARWTWPPRAP